MLPALLAVLGALPPGEARAQALPAPESFHVGGSLRFSYFVKSWEGQQVNLQRWGNGVFDLFQLTANGRLSNLQLSADFRFYAGYALLHHGFATYAFSESTQVQLGVQRVPFGLLPFASHNWFVSMPFYLGFEDDNDLGLKLIHTQGPWNLQFAYYKNDEGNYLGRSTASARYSYDVVPVRSTNATEAYLGVDQANSETNQLNARVAYLFTHGATASTELGLSAQVGRLYNAVTQRTGPRWAAAAHLEGNYGPFKLKLEAMHYVFRPANPEGEDTSFVTLGAYDAPYKVASQGTIVAAGASYGWPLDGSLLTRIAVYNDFSLLKKVKAGYATSYQNTTGALFVTGPVFTYVDLAFGQNHPWLGPNYGDALVAGSPTAPWEARFNINTGYYF